MNFYRSFLNNKSVTFLGYHCYPRYLSPCSFSSSSSSKQNYYDVLGVDKNCSRKEIRKAFLDKSKEYHPDSVSRSELSSDQLKTKFQEINEAYQVLNDPTERRVYDESIKYPSAGFSKSRFGGTGYGNYSDYQQYRAHQEFMRNQSQYWANYDRSRNQEYEEFTWKNSLRWKYGQSVTVFQFFIFLFAIGLGIEVLHSIYIYRYFAQVKRDREMFGPDWFQIPSPFNAEKADEEYDRFILSQELRREKAQSRENMEKRFP